VPEPTTIDQPEWPELLRAVQEHLAARIHTCLPGIVRSYDVATQTATVELAVQLLGNTVPPLPEVPVMWPGGAAGHLHVPLAAGDTVMVLFSEEDFSGWWGTGSISAPRVLARHGLHALAIPGLRRAAAALAVTGGHVTLAASGAVHLGSDVATQAVVLQTSPATWKTVFDAWAALLAPPGSEATPVTLGSLKTAMQALSTALGAAGWPANFNAIKVNAV